MEESQEPKAIGRENMRYYQLESSPWTSPLPTLGIRAEVTTRRTPRVSLKARSMALT